VKPISYDILLLTVKWNIVGVHASLRNASVIKQLTNLYTSLKKACPTPFVPTYVVVHIYAVTNIFVYRLTWESHRTKRLSPASRAL
jgi:hypothetical protein